MFTVYYSKKINVHWLLLQYRWGMLQQKPMLDRMRSMQYLVGKGMSKGLMQQMNHMRKTGTQRSLLFI